MKRSKAYRQADEQINAMLCVTGFSISPGRFDVRTASG